MSVKIALAQFESGADKDQNVKNVELKISEAASAGARLVVSVDMLQRSLAVEIDNTWAAPLVARVA